MLKLTDTARKELEEAVDDLIHVALCYQSKGAELGERLNYLHMTRLGVPEIVEQIEDSTIMGDYTVEGWEALLYDARVLYVCNIARQKGYIVFKNKAPVDYRGLKLDHYQGELTILAIDPDFQVYCRKKREQKRL